MMYIANLLLTVFSANVGEGGAEQRAFLDRIARSRDSRQRDGIFRELEAALGDPSFDWDALLDANEVYPDEHQTGRAFVVDRIWTPLFGREAKGRGSP